MTDALLRDPEILQEILLRLIYMSMFMISGRRRSSVITEESEQEHDEEGYYGKSAFSTPLHSRPGTARSLGANKQKDLTPSEFGAMNNAFLKPKNAFVDQGDDDGDKASSSPGVFSQKRFHQSQIREHLGNKPDKEKSRSGILLKRRPATSTALRSHGSNNDDDDEGPPSEAPSRATSAKHRRQPHARNSAITQAVNQVRVMTMANKRKRNVTAEQAWIMPQPITQRQKQFKENLMDLNAFRANKVDKRLQSFMEKYPVKNYLVEEK